MKVLNWDESLSVQLGEVDDDHRRLVELFNLLVQSVEEGTGSEYTEAVFEELVSCTIWHFRHEERLMLQYGYQDFAQHKSEHQELIDSARQAQQKFLQSGSKLSSEDIESLERWLVGHIYTSDMEMAAYLCEVMK